ncbi:transporter substrate-binding domain-containing protein [Anaerotignum propionicum]|uniref:transporter substrate-binding domain-containing protein n=1 Tax=Anaerotignum propionicum TaxID=28446 RepID=UPI002108D6DA|nr:transporter substrate-binding domain-containing protein [Anaerotignum propionicum]MCQ4936656.1 transporter substrate-binding domain-containing protein [Anaerotignum propionicum]
MKKFLKGFLATTMVFAMTAALVGCGGSKGAEQPAGDKDAENAAKETLIMATNAEFPPYEYHEGQSIVGIDAEIGAAIAEKLGYNFQIDDMAFDSIIPAVTSGKASFGMAGMTVTPDRLESVDFSDSYATGIQVVIVKEDSAITSVDDLLKEGAKHSVGVQTGTTGDIYASDDIEGKGLGTIERYNKGADAVQSLATGKIDCVIIDKEPAKAFVEANQGLKILDTEYAVEDYAICFAKDSELTEKVNGALKDLVADGTVQKIIDKYIKAE